MSAVETAVSNLEYYDVVVIESTTLNNPCLSIVEGKITCFNPDMLQTSAEQCTALYHECGHYISGAFYTPYSKYIIKEQAEYKANKAAMLEYIPKNEIAACVDSGYTELWQLAEHFNITEDFMLKAILFYKEQELVVI